MKSTYLANHHAHTHYSDGRKGPEAYLEEAISQNMEIYGFTDHAPIRSEFIGAMTLAQLDMYLQEIEKLKQSYSGKIQIYKGLEVDYFPGLINLETDYIQAANLDYIIGAVHFVGTFPSGRPWGFQSSHAEFEAGLEQIFEGDIKVCVHKYYEQIREMILHNTPPDIVAHLDRIKKLNYGDRYFREEEPWYRAEVVYTLELMASTDCILEVNTKGYYSQEIDTCYPGKWVLEIARELGIPVHLASDAHKPENITKGFAHGTEMIAKAGYQEVKILYNGKWENFPLKQNSVYALG